MVRFFQFKIRQSSNCVGTICYGVFTLIYEQHFEVNPHTCQVKSTRHYLEFLYIFLSLTTRLDKYKKVSILKKYTLLYFFKNANGNSSTASVSQFAVFCQTATRRFQTLQILFKPKREIQNDKSHLVWSFYVSLLNNFHEVRLFFASKTNLEFGLILSILERTCFFLVWSEASWLKGCA